MPISKVLQSSFTGGEMSDRMLARTDLQTYVRSAKTMENCYPFTHGGVTRRAGTNFISEVRDSTRPVRLIPFTYSKEQSYLLIFNGGRMEVVKDKEFILSGGNPYNIAIPYSDSELNEVRYAQAGNIIFFAHPNHPPKQLIRTSDTSWAFSNLDFIYDAVTDIYFENDYIRFKIVAAGDGHEVGDYYEIVTDGLGGFFTGGPFNGSGGDAPVGALTAVSVNTTNLTAETWTITCTVKSETREEWDVVGTTSGRPPVQWSTGNYPNAVSFHAQRLWFGGSNARPQSLWGSAAGDYATFTVGPLADDGLNFQIASNAFDEIIHLESARQLLIFTYGGEFTLAGAAGGISPSSVDLRRHTMHGSTDTKPIRIGQEVLFVQRDKKKLRAISFDVTLDANVAPDVTILAEHITREGDADGIGDIAFAQDPDYLAWAIRDDGVLLTLTHMRDQEVTAWAKHRTQDGLFKNVAAIPEGSTDTVYFVIERTIDGNTKQYLEHLCPCKYVDSALAASTSTPTDTWAGLDHLEGEEVAIVADGRVHPNRTVTGGQVTLQRNVSEVIIGLPYTNTLEMLHPSVPLSDGTAQGRQLTIKSAVVRLKDTVGLKVNGEDVPVIQMPLDQLDAPPVAYTGDKEIYVQGWTYPNNLIIQQELPMAWTVLGVILKVDVNE